VAVIVADPAPTPVTKPLELTVAANALSVDHVTVWPDITLPFGSLTVAWRGVVAPTAIDEEAGETVTVVTTGMGGAGLVDVDTTFESPPNTAPPLMAPRNATT
jgi:hypothetical protein